MRLLIPPTNLNKPPATALEAMTPNPKSVTENTTIGELAEALHKYGIHAVPVIDAAGRPKGVVTRTDVIEYWNSRTGSASAAIGQSSVSSPRHQLPSEHTVRHIMTPALFHVHQSAPIADVADRMLALEIQCLFVTDKQGVLIGTIDIFAALRHVAPDYTWHDQRSCKEDFSLAEPSWELPTTLRI